MKPGLDLIVVLLDLLDLLDLLGLDLLLGGALQLLVVLTTRLLNILLALPLLRRAGLTSSLLALAACLGWGAVAVAVSAASELLAGLPLELVELLPLRLVSMLVGSVNMESLT